MADHALQLNKDGRRQLIIERLIKKTQDGTLGKETGEPMPSEEDMAVSVGDTTTTNHHYNTPPSQSSGLSKAAQVAALLLAGAGLGALGIAAWNATQHSDPTPVIVPGNDDTNTQYGLRLFQDEK